MTSNPDSPTPSTPEEKKKQAKSDIHAIYRSWRSRITDQEAKDWADDKLWPAIHDEDWRKVFALSRKQTNKGLQELNVIAQSLVNLTIQDLPLSRRN